MLGLAQGSFLLLILAQPLMKLHVPAAGHLATVADLVYLIVAALWGLSLMRGETALRWHPFYLVLGLYFAALAASALVTPDPRQTAVKLLTQLYLLSLPVLAYNLLRTQHDLKRALLCWLAATAGVALLGFGTLILFAAGVDKSVLDYPLHHYGTLPPGDYPRLELTFKHPAMLCNYLTPSLAILLVCRRLGWIGKAAFAALLAGILASAAFAITPGLGGIVLMLGLWYWLELRERSKLAGRLSLAAGTAGAVLFLGSAAVTPILHSTAPFSFTVPVVDVALAPSARALFWADALRNFLAHPLLGQGIGTPAIDIPYRNPSNLLRSYTDAHNMFLSIAAQSGIVGLCGLLVLLGAMVRRVLPLWLGNGPWDALRLGLGLALLNGFGYQGLAGSFEDARHLWLLLGLFLAAEAVSRSSRPEQPEPDRPGAPTAPSSLPIRGNRDPTA